MYLPVSTLLALAIAFAALQPAPAQRGGGDPAARPFELTAQTEGEDGAAMPPPRMRRRMQIYRDETGVPVMPPGQHDGFPEGLPPGDGVPGQFGPPFPPGPGGFRGGRHPGMAGGPRFFDGAGSAGQPGGFPGRGGRQQMGGGRQIFGGALNLQPLNLSEEQKQRIRDMRAQSSARARDLKKSLKEKRLEMRDMMFDPQSTESQIRAKRQELRRVQDQLEDVVIGDFLSVRSLLTPEQRKRLPEIKPGAAQPQPGGPAFAGRPNRGQGVPGQRFHSGPARFQPE